MQGGEVADGVGDGRLNQAQPRLRAALAIPQFSQIAAHVAAQHFYCRAAILAEAGQVDRQRGMRSAQAFGGFLERGLGSVLDVDQADVNLLGGLPRDALVVGHA